MTVLSRTSVRSEWKIDGVPLLVAGVAISAAIVLGMFVGSTFAVLAAAAAAMIVGLFYPPIGLVVVAFMAPLRPPQSVPAPGFMMILVGAIVLGCIFRLSTDRPHFSARPPLLLLLAYVLYVTFQQLPEMAAGYPEGPAHDIGYLYFQLLTGLGIILAAGIVLQSWSPYPYLAALLISATLAALLAIVTTDGIPLDGLANLMPPPDVASRATGPFGNPNSFGQSLAYASVLAAGWLVTTNSVRLRTALIVVIGILAYAISLSLSRGALAALFAGLVVLAFTRSRSLGIAALAVALALIIVGYPLFVDLRLSTEAGAVSSESLTDLATSDQGRLDAILAGPALFLMSPVFGIGFGQYQYMSPLVIDQGIGLVAHNWYGTVLAEQGLLGIGIWVLTFATVAVWLRMRPAKPRSIGLAMLGAVAVGCLFLEPPTSFQTSALPSIVVTAALVGSWGGKTGRGAAATNGARSDVGDRPTLAAFGVAGRRNEA